MFNASALKANQEGIYIEYIKFRSKFELFSVKTKLFYKQVPVHCFINFLHVFSYIILYN